MATPSAAVEPSVADQLRADMLAGRLQPGERLMEIQLAERFQCGRAAVRAALIELQAEGLISREANRGASVRRITIEEAVQITEARAALESLIAAEAARKVNDDERHELQALVDDMRAAVAEDRQSDYSDMNRVLHRRLEEISGHRVAGELIQVLRNRAAHHQYRLSMMPGRPAESVEQHAAIVAAVAAGDADAASAAMGAHLASVIDVLHRWGDAQ
jgi:DNA-binding GntR family transcriptional regulator